jgi:hypothetical protein
MHCIDAAPQMRSHRVEAAVEVAAAPDGPGDRVDRNRVNPDRRPRRETAAAAGEFVELDKVRTGRGNVAIDECLPMALTTMTVTCPHCEAEIEVRIETKAAVAPPLKLSFASVAEFAQWLKASRLSVDEFRQLPVYEWHRDQLEPLARAVANDAEDDSNEWHRDQLGPPTRAAAEDAEDDTANAEAGLDELSGARSPSA